MEHCCLKQGAPQLEGAHDVMAVEKEDVLLQEKPHHDTSWSSWPGPNVETEKSQGSLVHEADDV